MLGEPDEPMGLPELAARRNSVPAQARSPACRAGHAGYTIALARGARAGGARGSSFVTDD